MYTDNNVGTKAVEQAVAAHRDGRFAEAIAAYESALANRPKDAEIRSLLGLALVHAGRGNEALRLLNQAVAAEPAQMGFRFNLAEGLIAIGDPVRAAAELRVILADNPDSFQVWLRLGDVAALQQDSEAAGRAWRRAFELGSKLTPGLKLARLELAQSHFASAQAVLDRLHAHYPAEEAVRSLQCDLLIARRDWAALLSFATNWTRAQPDQPDALRALARAQFETGRYPDAVRAFAKILATPAPGADDLAALAGLQLHALDFDAAATTLDRAEAIAPDNPGVQARNALLHMYYGRFSAATDCARRSLAADAENVSAFVTLSRVLHGRLAQGELDVLEGIARQTTAPLDHRIPAAFMLADAYDARGDTDGGFAAYKFAQSLALERDRLEGRSYDAAASESRFERLARLLPPAQLDTRQTSTARPIFIVGMPRSGTTLVECVLGAHSRVFACGERVAMRQLLGAALELDAAGRAADAASLAAWATAYLSDLPDLRAAGHFTDKHPLNFEALGLIAQMFPTAAIFHVRRNPIETCLSVYRQEFSKPWTFAHRLEDIGHFYGQQAQLMAHWQRELPGRIMTVQYEEFAADLAARAQQLIESLGLEWEPACATFQQAGRPIATFSTVEARGPVTVRNNRAMRYHRHLVPLIAALRSAGIDLATGALNGEGGMHDPAAG